MKKKIMKKTLLYVGGLFLLAIGINISKTAQLGISPVSSVPYALELIWGFELGKSTTIVYVIFMLLQIILLRKNYKPVQLLQIICTYILSFFIDYTGVNYLLSWMPVPSLYIVKLLYLFISIIIMGIGLSLYLISNFVPLPPEGLANAIVEISKDKLQFSNAKVALDSTLVMVSAILSIIFLGGLKSVREGTVLSALLIGRSVGFIFKKYKPSILEWIEAS